MTLYKFNPYGGVTKDEVNHTLVPIIDLNAIALLVKSKTYSGVIEFVGKKGRGKSSHLFYLHNLLREYPLFQLAPDFDFQEMIYHPSPVILIDSFHQLQFKQKRILYKQKRTIILTTHISRFIEYKVFGLKHETYKFNGINKRLLKEIILRRHQLAAKDGYHQLFDIDDTQLQMFIKKYKDNFRGILNELYDNF